ncbi:hypothetical protein A2866_00165 [Candidatus Roizmanbacteria bacterium RIFCSPHIGHO2_01_FULL_39_8]|uniref:Right handed beta helix domain-containing protein n=1 Tax=Candidatus Roizmanbacteria bacterium RIFCSPHIGHO2_01_FULL_39_8 TaxID=1802033 RepID=A0A1F7GQT0_9BACT|nr:MAG: hypothetical protein A2866_00165 [Candidatus Roizmanbacteria bacterium RIFCSPHIGHO2_01_FULL_39_8]
MFKKVKALKDFVSDFLGRKTSHHIKIALTLMLSFFITSFSSQTLFFSNTPRIDSYKLASAVKQLGSLLTGSFLAESAPTDSTCVTSTNIDAAGSYKFCAESPELAQGITIASPDVSLYCEDKIISGSKAPDSIGITINQSNVSIFDCNVNGFFIGLLAQNVNNITVKGGNYSDNSYGSEVARDKGSQSDLKENLGRQNQKTGAGVFFEQVSDSHIIDVEANASVAGLILSNSSRIEVGGGNFSDNSGWGIKLARSSNNTITGVSANNNYRWCIDGDGKPGAGCETAGILLVDNSDYNTIQDSTFNNNGDGFYINGCSGHTPSSNNKILRNTANGSQYGNAFEATFSSLNTFEGNSTSDSRFGYWLGYSNNTIVKNNYAKANLGGINIANSSCNLVENNTSISGDESHNKVWLDLQKPICQERSELIVQKCENTKLVSNNQELNSQSCGLVSTLPASCIIKSDGGDIVPTESPTCSDPTGAESYNGILVLGPHATNHRDAGNLVQTRKFYNCDNAASSEVKSSFIPYTVIYDLFFLKGDVNAIKQNLEDLKKYGLYPVIRVASYTNGAGVWIKVGPSDARIMGQNLAAALNQVSGFPKRPIVLFGNEVNLHAEWEGQTNPEEFTQSLAAFMDGMGSGNFDIYYPALSYGADGNNGLRPADFLSRSFGSQALAGKKLVGVGLNIYGADNGSIQSQFGTQTGAFSTYGSYFNQPLAAIITEMGPTDDRGVVADCSSEGPWPGAAVNVINGYKNAPSGSLATMTCFTNDSPLTVIHFDDTPPRLIAFGTNYPTQPPQVTTTGQPTTPLGQPTNTPAPTQPGGATSTPPSNQSGTVTIVLHKDSLDGPVWNEQTKAEVYIEGPAQAGRTRFGELLYALGSAGTNCKSRGGFPYDCPSAGTVVWKGADGKSGTSPGSYKAILFPPQGWNAILETTSGTLNSGGSLTLNLVISNKNLPTIPPPTQGPTPTGGGGGNLSCPTTSSQAYTSMRVNANDPNRIQRPVESSPDVNLRKRGWVEVDESKELQSRNGNNDGLDPLMPPQISSLYNGPIPSIIKTYRIYEWDFQNNKSLAPQTASPKFKVHMIGLAANSGQQLYGLKAGRSIGDGKVFQVLYATKNDILFTHSGGSDNLEDGYLYYFIDICVDPNLLARYQSDNSGGRQQLPVIATGQIFGTATSSDPKVVYRDSGSFVDPRAKEDLWFYPQ